ncbi:helix-turn-helix domain-containing protein [Arthrobacter cryoconiti]|uniref:Helix-turn-helix domain-containing protein n=1 Tax=Arthrobacter cryoconiti TaxID=748907 RepID=A0ABV8R277_9MICC|nr:helix-turn-helix transcriptional regulator [Arthrobacter cryoconiti]MCC9069968.1 helix-turn-helix transcriptional regulator [Arthrobacter cryoconiti]
MSAINVGGRVKVAYEAAGLTQRELSDLTEISQPTLSRIVVGDRVAKANELVDIARVTGIPLSQLTGSGAASRVFCAARATNGAQMTQMRDKLIEFADLNSYLDAQAIPA